MQNSYALLKSVGVNNNGRFWRQPPAARRASMGQRAMQQAQDISRLGHADPNVTARFY